MLEVENGIIRAVRVNQNSKLVVRKLNNKMKITSSIKAKGATPCGANSLHRRHL